MKKLLLAGVAVAALSLAPTAAFAQAAPATPATTVLGGSSSSNPWAPWAVFGCASSIILSAFAANYRDNRELTQPEAWTCGLLFWLSYPRQEVRVRRR